MAKFTFPGVFDTTARLGLVVDPTMMVEDEEDASNVVGVSNIDSPKRISADDVKTTIANLGTEVKGFLDAGDTVSNILSAINVDGKSYTSLVIDFDASDWYNHVNNLTFANNIAGGDSIRFKIQLNFPDGSSYTVSYYCVIEAK